MAAATITLKLNNKGQATPEDALHAAIAAVNAVKIDYTGMTEDRIARLKRLASSLTENGDHTVSRARREFTDQTVARSA
jgi:endonuclease III